MGRAITIKARFSRGFIEPLEKLEFEEGKEITLTISDISVFKKKSLVEALRATSGGWKGLIDAEQLKKDIYFERLIISLAELYEGFFYSPLFYFIYFSSLFLQLLHH